MLIHHFGSKEELIGAVMGDVRDRLQVLLRSVESKCRSHASDVMLAFWQRSTSRVNLPYLRLLLEAQVLATQHPKQYRAYLRTTSASWLSLVEGALPAGKDRAARATLCTAVIDGLLLELLSTGDKRRTTRALELFAPQSTSKQLSRTPRSPGASRRS
jgi:AcrR family transcriptional regulator